MPVNHRSLQCLCLLFPLRRDLLLAPSAVIKYSVTPTEDSGLQRGASIVPQAQNSLPIARAEEHSRAGGGERGPGSILTFSAQNPGDSFLLLSFTLLSGLYWERQRKLLSNWQLRAALLPATWNAVSTRCSCL